MKHTLRSRPSRNWSVQASLRLTMSPRRSRFETSGYAYLSTCSLIILNNASKSFAYFLATSPDSNVEIVPEHDFEP